MNEIMDNDNEFKKYLETAKWNSLPDEFVVFDTETTGLTPKSDRILEIGAILFRKDDYLKTGEVTTFQCFIKQDKPIPADATAINGITDDMVKDGDSEYAALTKFFEFVESRPLFAYNAKFDKDFLKATAKRCEYFDEDFSLEVEDVMPIVSEVFTDLPNRKLTTVAKHIGGQNTGAHRALHDCAMTLQVLIHCKQTLMVRDSVEAREMYLELGRKTTELQAQLKQSTSVQKEESQKFLLISFILVILVFIFFGVVKK
jgi:DNA polymerase-3 subunit alpha (Gram-positive type)